MKYLLLLPVFVLAVGCAKKTSYEQVPAPATPASQSPGTNNVGTRGGGGTLVFTFKQAAEVARNKMMVVSLPFSNTPENETKNDLYVSMRSLWIEALNKIAQDSNLVSQTQDSLTDLGLVVGAKSLPADNPTYIVLSEPYLNTGFTADQAFVLAVHEAAHLIYPNMSEGEHALLDQIGMALLNK